MSIANFVFICLALFSYLWARICVPSFSGTAEPHRSTPAEATGPDLATYLWSSVLLE